MVSINEIQTFENLILAACDKELLGQSYEEGELQLNVREEFYGGEIVTMEIFEEKLKNVNIANLVGEKVVNKALELGMASESAVIKIAEIPHVQIVNI